MAKVSTERVLMDKVPEDVLDFKYDINVGVDGVFSTTLPKAIVEKFKKANISLKSNRMDNPGYFCDKSFDNLKAIVRGVCEEYYSREKTSEQVIIRYVIKTTCTYCMDVDGNIVPNASEEWTKAETRTTKTDWRQGTETQHAASPRPFGMEVYARPFYRREYKYKSGIVKTEYEEITSFDHFKGDKKKQFYLYYLISVCSMSRPDSRIQEIEYTESSAKFFVDMIRGICHINEKIKQFAEPEVLDQFLKSGGVFALASANKIDTNEPTTTGNTE